MLEAASNMGFISLVYLTLMTRVRDLNKDLPSKIAAEVKDKRNLLQKTFDLIMPDLQGINAWRYQNQISPGLQEFVEAVSFEYYLCNQSLITLDEASDLLPKGFLLTANDYVLGIFDLVGELMRFAITTMATTGKLPASKSTDGEERDILADVRYLRTKFEDLNTSTCSGSYMGKEYTKKLTIMQECVQKIETAVCNMTIRGQERPKGWNPEIYESREIVLESN